MHLLGHGSKLLSMAMPSLNSYALSILPFVYQPTQTESKAECGLQSSQADACAGAGDNHLSSSRQGSMVAEEASKVAAMASASPSRIPGPKGIIRPDSDSNAKLPSDAASSSDAAKSKSASGGMFSRAWKALKPAPKTAASPAKVAAAGVMMSRQCCTVNAMVLNSFCFRVLPMSIIVPLVGDLLLRGLHSCDCTEPLR